MMAAVHAPSQREVERLSAIAARLQSEHDGEIVNAARLLVKNLDRHGMRIADVVARAFAEVPAPPSMRRFSTAPSNTPHGTVARRALRHPDLFTVVELKFLTDVPSLARLSPKQQRWLDMLAERVPA